MQFVSAGCHEHPRACRLPSTDILIPNCVPLSFCCFFPPVCMLALILFFAQVIQLFISVRHLTLLYAGSYTACPVSTIDIKLRNSPMFFMCVQNNVTMPACKSTCLRNQFHKPISGMGPLNFNIPYPRQCTVSKLTES